MTLIVDPDYLSQGANSAVITDVEWNSIAGANAIIYSAGTNLPSWSAGEYFEVRDAFSDANNNGLYVVRTVNVDTSNVVVSKVDGPIPVDVGAANATFFGSNATLTGTSSTMKTVMINTNLRYIYLLPNSSGNLIEADGATLQALYSFLKEEWKNDDTLNPHPFPMVAITPEQFEFIYDWEPRNFVPGTEGGSNITTRKIIRTGGWREIDTVQASKLKQEYIGVITLGTFEDNNNDTVYYQVGNDPTDTTATTDFSFAGPVNEAIQTYYENVPADTGTGFAFASNVVTRNDGGNWASDGFRIGAQVTVLGSENTGENDGTYVITAVENGVDGNLQVSGTPFTTNSADTTARFARNYRNAIKLFLRVRDADPNGKTFGQSQLSDIGVTSVVNQVYRFPLTNATDLKISETDANIGSQSPYTQINVRYFDQAFSRDVDGTTNRDFGIVIDVGTFSGVDGATTAAGANLTTAEAGIPTSTYDGGTLTMLEGTDEGTSFSITTADGANVQTNSTFTASESNLSFVLQRSTPVTATLVEIYEKVQYLLRQASDIDSTDQIVTGKTADVLLRFVGDNLEAGQSIPSNPNGGGSGVIIEGFDSNDTNALTFFDNTGTGYNYPFVAAGSIAFNDNLVDDGSAEYWMFYTYTERFTNTGFGLSASSGSTATLDSSTTDLVSELAVGDYIALSGFTDPNNNGIWLVTGAPAGTGPWTAAVRKINGDTVSNETAGASISLDKNPINSPDAIIVNNNSGSPITGAIGGSSVSFDFDYDNNVQGGRTAATVAAITIRAIGLTTAQFVETTGTITRATGLSFSLVAGLERNYTNPA